MSSRNVIFVGGPGAGKTNYLFRIWIALERETGQLVKSGLPDDLAYLHEGASLLFDGKFAPHTSRDSHHTAIIPVRWRQDPAATGALIVPDASGEVWLELYQKRAWSKQWDDLIAPQTGIVLMVCEGSPHNIPALDWVTCERLYGMQHKPVPTDTPTQVMLVDWLQILRSVADRKRNEQSSRRLSIVISGWDRLNAEEIQSTPMEYLRRRFPLLAQFIEAGASGFDVRLFGLSIFGGDPDQSGEYRRRIQTTDAAELGYVVKPLANRTVRSPDILEPIYWTLGVGG